MRRLDLTEVYPTAHMVRVMGERGVQWSEVATALSSPHVVEAHQGRWRYVRGDLVVVVAGLESCRPALVTVLWRRGHQWRSGEMRQRNWERGDC